MLAKVQAGEADAGLVYKTDVQAAGNTVKGIEFDESAKRLTVHVDFAAGTRFAVSGPRLE